MFLRIFLKPYESNEKGLQQKRLTLHKTFLASFLCSVRELPDLRPFYRFECDQFSLYSKAHKMIEKGVD